MPLVLAVLLELFGAIRGTAGAGVSIEVSVIVGGLGI